MLRIELLPERIVTHATRRNLPTWSIDNGYLVHSILGEAFGDGAPSPFAIQDERGRRLGVLAYAGLSAEALQERARRFADPLVYDTIHWPTFASKPMPASWPEASSYRFQVRAHPVVRLARKDAPFKVGAEVDAYLARCWQEPPEVPVSREEVYERWLKDWFARREAAEIDDILVTRFQLTRLTRRTQGSQRSARHPEGPDVTFTGRCRVTHPEGFLDVLRRGVGRHRGFGFGMLLLKPE
jgi:CRISPR system Cascade subunit CasE